MSDIAFDTPIVMLHGLGGRPFTCIPLEFYLRCSGYQNIHRPWYPADQYSDIEKGLAALDEILLQRGLRKDQPIVAIGQSMGGVYANRLHERGWRVLLGIYIGSPMNGAALLPILEKKLPQFVQDYMMKPPYEYLKKQEPASKPPHPFKTITPAWGWSNFDGCVFTSDTIIEEEHNTYLPFMDHRTGFASVRLWRTVGRLMQSQ